MVAAIGSTSSAVATTAPSGGLRAELARMKKEYSACINCASANTEAGRQNIQQLDTRIQQIQARIDAAVPPAASPTLPQGAGPIMPVAATQSVDASVSATGAKRIDTYA